MKSLKRIISFLACLCMMVCMVPTIAQAANGELRFSDPETTVGATFEVTARMSADESIDEGNATLTYDSSYLRFVSGSGVTDNGGSLQITGNGNGASELNWSMTFQALAEGTTKIEISNASAVASNGSSISITHGSSTITIGPGDPSLIQNSSSSGGFQVEVDGALYTVSSEFSEILVPDGFTKTEMTLNGQTCPAAVQESSGKYVLLMTDAAGEEDFYLYDPDNGSFVPFCQISISDERFLIMLSEDKTSELPEYLQQTTMTIDGKEFIAWQNTESTEYYVVYAVNSDGKEGYYQYDTVDGTYQRYVPEVVVKEEVPTSELDKILEKIEDNLFLCILVVAFVFVLLFFILIIVAIKLRHRNLELDDLYDEYGIDLDEEEEEEPVKAKKEKKGLFGKKSKKDDLDDWDDDDFDDEYDEDDYEEDAFGEDDYEDDVFEAYEYNASDYEDEDDIDDLDGLLSAQAKGKISKNVREDDMTKAVPTFKSPAKSSKPAAKAPAKSAKPAAKAPARQGQKPAVKPAAPRKAAPQPVAPTVGKPQQRVGHSDFDDTFKMDLIDLD